MRVDSRDQVVTKAKLDCQSVSSLVNLQKTLPFEAKGPKTQPPTRAGRAKAI
jgi:hypothetical protein